MSELSIPAVHLNGTSYDVLIQQVEDAHTALMAAREALSRMAPNGRDFYPRGDHALTKATAEHYLRVEALRKIDREVMEIWEGILDQGGYPGEGEE